MIFFRLALAAPCVAAAWEWASYYEQPRVSHIAASCYAASRTYDSAAVGGATVAVSSCSSSQIVGVGGSAGSCARSYAMPVWLVPVDGALAWVDGLELRLDVADASQLSDVVLDLYGLGLRNGSAGVAAADFSWLGAAAPGVARLADGVVALGRRHARVDLTNYTKSLYEEWVGLGDPEPWFAAFRLSGVDDLGCEAACDSGCSIRRAYVDTANTTFRATLRADLVDAATSMTSPIHQSAHVTATCAADGAVGLAYAPDADGNVLPDFSKVGYREGAEPPVVAGAASVAPRADGGDDARAIQAAIDLVAALPLGADGFRGAVELGAGTFHVNTTLVVGASGVVVRGAGEGLTTVWATRREEGFVLFEAGVGHGARRSEVAGSRTNLSDAYVAVGATAVRVDDASGFAAGDTVVVERAPSAEWIASIGAWSPAQIYMHQG